MEVPSPSTSASFVPQTLSSDSTATRIGEPNSFDNELHQWRFDLVKEMKREEVEYFVLLLL